MNSESLEVFGKSWISWIKGSLLTVFFFLLCLLQTVVGIFFLHSQSQVIWSKSWSSSDSSTRLWNTCWEVVHPIWGWVWRLSVLYVTGDLYDLNTLVMPLQSVTVCYFLPAVTCCCPVNVFLCLLLTSEVSFHILCVWKENFWQHTHLSLVSGHLYPGYVSVCLLRCSPDMDVRQIRRQSWVPKWTWILSDQSTRKKVKSSCLKKARHSYLHR